MFHRVLPHSFIIVVAAACFGAPAPPTAVRPGIDVLVTDSLHLLNDRRVGLITNQTGITRDGRSDVEALLDAGVNLTTLFSPEHGFRGVLDQPDIDHAVDSATGLPIYSLYGRTRSPTPDMFQNVDVLLIDLQDIGARTYTYISTALLAMRAAAPLGRRVIVLDRPNPIGGVQVQGPVLDTAHASFVGMLPVPQRHGLTFGELALLGNEALGIGSDLSVVPVSGWYRDMWFDEVGLPWVRPSPNMPDLESATHYPGLVVFEATNLSVGRGTDRAFQVVGAPWLRPQAVLAVMESVAGVVVRDTSIVPRNPTDDKYPDRSLPAVALRVDDRTVYDPVRTAVSLLAAIRDVHGDSLVINAAGFDRLAGGSALREAIEAGAEAGAVWAGWPEAIAVFESEVRPPRLYSPRP